VKNKYYFTGEKKHISVVFSGIKQNLYRCKSAKNATNQESLLFFFPGNDVSCACVMIVLVRSLSLSHVSSCATTMTMLTVWQATYVYYLILLSAIATTTNTITIIIDGGGSSSNVGWWCTCVRVIFCSKRVTHSRDFFSSSTCYSYTTMPTRIHRHTHNEEDLTNSVVQAITSYTHT
jgi:hypothetical protein